MGLQVRPRVWSRGNRDGVYPYTIEGGLVVLMLPECEGEFTTTNSHRKCMSSDRNRSEGNRRGTSGQGSKLPAGARRQE